MRGRRVKFHVLRAAGFSHPYLRLPRPMILAHRGDSAHAPENTLPAFMLAVERGADALETDIHWTKDGHIVVCHNDTVDACSDGHGRICDLTLAQLKAFDFGYTFTPDGGKTYPYRGRGVQILTFRELLLAFPNVRVNVDIKPKDPPSLRQLAEEICAVGAQHRVLVASFHHKVLQRFRKINRAIATSASMQETAWWWLSAKFGRTAKGDYDALQVPVSFRGLPVVTEATLNAAHRTGKPVHVWTVDDPNQMRDLLRLGVDGIVTNDPALARTICGEFHRES